MKTITIDGSAITNIDTFYDEIYRKFCPNLKGFGRNLDAFNDVLRGGFGEFEYGTPIKLVWTNSNNSKIALGYGAKANYLRRIKVQTDRSNYKYIDARISEADRQEGRTLFDQIIEVIKAPEHANRINLILE
jgi:RNAse (barnase) inhibitor barstar